MEEPTTLSSGQIEFLRLHPRSRPVPGLFGTLFVYEHCDGRVNRYTIAPSGRLLNQNSFSTTMKDRAGAKDTSESQTVADLEELWQAEPYTGPSSI